MKLLTKFFNLQGLDDLLIQEGKGKHGDNGWREKDLSVHYTKFHGHFDRWNSIGGHIDPDSGRPSIDHAIIRLLMIRELTKGES